MKRINSIDKRALRSNLCKRADGRCAYCQRRIGMAGTVDHYLPQALGGTNEKTNLRWSCVGCNNLKADEPTKAEIRARMHRLIVERAKGART